MNTIDYIIEQISTLKEDEFLQIGEKTVVEEAGFYKEYAYIVIFHAGFRQGYICAPTGSLLDITTDNSEEIDELQPITNVHGGLTHCSRKLPFKNLPVSGHKWLGFKANHKDTDDIDHNALRTYRMFPFPTMAMIHPRATVKNIPFMIFQCHALINDIIKLELAYMMDDSITRPNTPQI